MEAHAIDQPGGGLAPSAEPSLLPGLKELSERAKKMLDFRFPILIVGETGSGKSMLARWIHQQSGRASGVLAQRGVGTFHDDSFVAELFGYVEGAFTGANRDEIGLLRGCDKGTLVLDDVDLLSPRAQTHLLHFLDYGTVTPLGAPNKTFATDVRIVATANSDLLAAMEAGQFREDLFYRLSTFTLKVPELSNRKEDIGKLVLRFEEEFSGLAGADEGRAPARLSEDAAKLLSMLHLPGNTRELRNVVFQVLALATPGRDNIISLSALVNVLTAPEIGHDHLRGLRRQIQGDNSLLQELLMLTGYNITLVSRVTNLVRQTIYNRQKRYNL